MKKLLVLVLIMFVAQAYAWDCDLTWVPSQNPTTNPTYDVLGHRVYITGQDCVNGLGTPGCDEDIFSVGPTELGPTATTTKCSVQGWTTGGRVGNQYFFVKGFNVSGESEPSDLACGNIDTGGPCIYFPTSPTITTITTTVVIVN